MKVRILFRDYEISDTNKQQLLYGVAVLVSILSVFSIIFMLSYYSENPTDAAFPSPTPGVFTALTAGEQQRALKQQQVQGAQTQIPPKPQPSQGPEKPTPKPSPSPSASPSPSVSPSPSPSPESSPSPSPSPSANASQAPDNRPKITNIAESDKTESGIKLKFSVDKSCDCKATYWKDENSKQTQESSTKRTTSPEITLTGLTAATEYTYQIECKDVDSNQTSTAGDYKFKTN